MSPSRKGGIFRDYLKVRSGEAYTVWGGRYYLVRQVPSGEAGTIM